MSRQCLPPSFASFRLTIREQMWIEDFKDGHLGGHLGCRKRTILAILNLYVAPMPPLKFQLHPIYGLGGDII